MKIIDAAAHFEHAVKKSNEFHGFRKKIYGNKKARDMSFLKPIIKIYDKDNKKPVIRCSICTGEMVAGFKDLHTGAFEEVMLIVGDVDLKRFKDMYGITGEIEKIY